jgi:hypothetical protein
MKVVRSIELEFSTGMGEVTSAQIVALCVAQVEGVLTQERIRGRIDSYDVRVVRPVAPAPDEGVELLREMIADGRVAYHPDDRELPEGDRRLVKTEKGEAEHARIKGWLAQREKAELS